MLPSVVPSKVSALPLVATLLPSRYSTPFAVPPDNVTVLDAESVVKAPDEGVDAPTVVPFTDPPVIATLFAFCVDIVPRPDTAVLAMLMAVLEAAVNRPCASTVNVPTCEAEP